MKRKHFRRTTDSQLNTFFQLLNSRTTAAIAFSVTLSIGSFSTLHAAPIAATPDTKVGDTVTHPVTGVDATVVQLILNSDKEVDHVLTSNGDVILTRTTVGSLIQPVAGGDVYKVISVVKNTTTGLVEKANIRLVTAKDDDPTIEHAVVSNIGTALEDEATQNAPTTGAPQVTPPTSTSGLINEVSKGASGGNGGNAYGVKIPTPWGDIVIAKEGSAGGNGTPGPTVNRTVGTNHGAINSTTFGTNGITLGSIGGDGGKGGNSYGNIPGYSGGSAGNGGTVNLDNRTSISTTQGKSHGIFAFSRSGKGGAGGTGYIFAEGGSGGAARDGGQVTVRNTGSIQTQGAESHGIYVLSVGGDAGNGGGSWGIVGEGGSGSTGGHGGNVAATNNANIRTEGRGSHGMLGQSIGGTGGNGGAAGAIVGFGGSASNGGRGGNVELTTEADSNIETTGVTSVGVFGQSIGGSGGDSGAAGGIVSLGGNGGSGNHAGTVTIRNQDGSQIKTGGQDSHGVFGQSIGGGGGNTSPTGGIVSIGGKSAGGGNGGLVDISSGAAITTGGKNAHGIFAQSIGGGGGSAGGVGGLVALGGDGGAGGHGDRVTIANTVAGTVKTTGVSSHAIFAQSIGGGGGAGGDSGGAVAIGGKGSGGGNAGTVSVTNSGYLSTEEKDSRGIFAQSIGGGGGSGGGSGGIVALGGGGSTGSHGNIVEVTNHATGGILTKGTGSDAIFAQSIGGGGGAGASSGGLVALGGNGSGGGEGRAVTVTNSGNLRTEGELARGIFAQSVGGGGGAGGSTGGLVSIGGSGSNTSGSGKVTVHNTGSIQTLKDKSTGIYAQSVGGGGGDGGSSGGVISIGGSGGSGGSSGDVEVKHGGQIFTGGNDAAGIFAQAVGGGGGNGGSAYSGGLFAGFALGGSGDKGGDGGKTTVTLEEFTLQGNLAPSIISTTGDRATGIIAQSVGGGGGNGGSAIQGTIGIGVSISTALGGKGDEGGKGGEVSLNGKGDVVTSGEQSGGVVLQSVGGGGGNGGTTVAGAASIGDGLAVAVAIGGSAGAGGDGGKVTGNAEMNIQTDGEFSTAFLAQSVGGGGGNGSTTVAGAGAVGVFGSGAVSVGVGGNGGEGGDGNHVDITLKGSVLTKQAQSDGVVLQSIGGGGGNGGMTIAGSAAGAGIGSGNISVAVGGGGADGGLAGRVDADLTMDVETLKEGSDGVVIQSIGGGGGNSGLTISAGLSGAGVGTGGVNVGVGGSSGGGGNGDIVDAVFAGGIITRGSHATGMLAQSVGGGGGNSSGTIAASLNGAGTGAGSISVAVGGSGGTGGDGGRADTENAVTLGMSGTVYTEGAHSSGIVAQSIGGGGGNGGYTVSGSIAGAGTGSGAIAVGIGGSGAGGGEGKGVTTNISSNVWTRGNDSSGIVSQSIGGGGGNGGFNVSAAGSGAGVGSGGVSVGLGGSGAGGGNAGKVNATSTGTIRTEGERAAAFVAQSIGGGGGNGGFNVSAAFSGAGTGSGTVGVGLGGSGAGGGNGGAVVAATSGDIVTIKSGSAGIVAQSVGGGGGNGGFNVSASGSGAGTGSGAVAVGLGGSGAGGGNGSTVDLTVNNDVSTKGNDSAGIIAQSVGGGGGNGAFDVSASGSGAGTGSGAVSVSLGGNAGTGGTGGDVTSSVTGDITTGGDRSTGLLVQSLGGGGGNGGFSVSAAISGAGTGSVGIAVGIGGSGGGGGNSGKVISEHTGDVFSEGKDSTGIVAQSIGGGGGNGGMNVSGTISGAGTGSGGIAVGIGGSGGGGGNSETVDNTVTGQIVTKKDGSGGVLAQSLGGGGGNGGLNVSGSISLGGTGSGAASVGIGGAGGTGGFSSKVTNEVTGNVYTTGDNGFGIAAQSIGGGGGNGGINVSGAISASKTGAGAVSVGIGGSGGNGGDGGEVDNTVTGYVQTLGDHATGILAQSLGGGGGNGALNVSGTITAAKTFSGGLAVGIGGFGGDGGDGKAVINEVTGGTVTTGNYSDGIVAQSLGGGGGNGGINVSGAVNLTKENGGAVGIGVGGFGGDGGNAGSVTSTVKTTTTHNLIGTTGDHSSAVVAQSIGGGGGNGGTNVTGTVNLSGKNGASIGVGIGGFGGSAGNADKVTLDVKGTVISQGDQSHGLLAQSIGGGGGNGGTNVTGSLALTTDKSSSSTAVAAAIGIGGFGGAAGNAGDVDVKYEGTLSAVPRVWVPEAVDPVTGNTIPGHYVNREDAASHGLAAQSIGGGGGNGGINVSGGISYASGKSDAYGLVVGFGGYGGDGGNAGNVEVEVTGGNSITGYGAGHSAILAQSLGGGGGNGALNVSGGISSDSPFILGVGGSGGNAGTAKDVTVKAATDVYASAVDSKNLTSAGILAQSIGGGGGNGGMNVSGGIAISKEGDIPSITVGVGGSGGSGAISGDVTVDHTGNAATSGAWVHGIMAQSIAGGGGNGALNVTGQINLADSNNSGGKTDLTITAGVGGSGGAGADAGNVSVTHNGVVTTKGDEARGVAAQSIGGGGGNGGMNVTGVFAKNSSPISVGVGGSGSGGGHAGSVTVNRGSESASTGKVTTDGKSAIGIEASSIGGGGGNAGMNFIAAVSMAGKDNTEAGFAAQFAIGGAGGEAGHGGKATVNNHSEVETKQKYSHGILAQSIGGGGGNANFNIAASYAGKNDKNMGFSLAVGGAPGEGGNGNTVDVTQRGNITTHGEQSFGILAQSVGGGGGNVGMDMATVKANGGKASISLGRVGGTGGTGADVTLRSSGNVKTHGKGSYGMLAQSVGNGGGNSSSTSVSVESDSTDTKPAESVAVSVGLEGGTGGRAGNVILEAEGSVVTVGENAHAIFAQSVGGGGGNAGSGNTSGLSVATASLALGGTGGSGGVSGTVKVTSSAQVRTSGDDAVGILAQSVGGGGGTGGMSRAGGIKSQVDGIAVSVGGKGGVGMASDFVSVANSGVIITSGVGSHGVLAQSLGGGGGNAGMSINAIGKDMGKDPKTRMSITIGGDGGDGAVSGDVEVTNTGGIGTNKERSVGIFAQSIGGGGGNASYVSSTSVTGESGGNIAALNIGGSGGTGAAAGDVTVSNLTNDDADSGKIITLGNYSHGIVAMSVGGGGGTGSTSINIKKGADLSSGATTTSFALSLGGAGGSGGTGGNVNVNNGGSITTYGYKAHGILAQSVGGGGGQGGMSITGDMASGKAKGDTDPNQAAAMSIGGSGGSGNKAGTVTVENSGKIDVSGKGAYGIYAQSVGGGGGDGGFAGTLSRDILTNPKKDLAKSLMNLGIGGNGGDGADGGNVDVNHTGTITARGDDAFGIFAQSVGGGGGNVGKSLTSPTWMAADLTISTLIGGRGGSDGTAGNVSIRTLGDIHMLGNNGTAYLGQSINGGGGNVDLFLDISKRAVALGEGGIELPDNGGDVDKVQAFLTSKIELGADLAKNTAGGLVEASHIGDLYTAGKGSIASLIQSIGGGGGNANSEVVVNTEANVDLELALGGKNSTNNGGGDMTVTRTGNVLVEGSQSQGTTAQSVGGGGGNLTVNVKKVPVTPAQPASAAPASPVTAPLAGQVTGKASLGATAGESSNGGNLQLDYSGNVMTKSARSHATVVQSIGGGGGQLNVNGADRLDLALGGKEHTSGDGGDIRLTNTGHLHTTGGLSHGMILQSVGGGGGAAFTDLRASQISLTLNAANRGDGGAITLGQKGDILVTGAKSIAVLAQSVGGGGGIVDRTFAGSAGGDGSSGAIDLALDGNIFATGREGIAVFAQSLAKDGQGDISVVLSEKKMIHAGHEGTGIEFSGGANNSFVNHGTIMTKDELAGMAVRGGKGGELIDNHGVFFGRFDLGGGANRFVNHDGGTLVSGTHLSLGAKSNELVNSGALSTGDTELAQRTKLKGSFTQTKSGVTHAELDFSANKLDGIDATGTAKLAGEVKVTLLNPHTVKAGDFEKDLFSAKEGVVDDGLKLTTIPSSVISYDLEYDGTRAAMLKYTVDFSAGGKLGKNLTEVGDYINRIQNAGSSPALAKTITKLIYDPTFDSYRESLSQLAPDFYGEHQAAFIRGGQRFGEIMATGGDLYEPKDGHNVWFHYETGDTTHSNFDDYKRVQHNSERYIVGLQKTYNARWTAGLAFGIEDTKAHGYDGRWTSEGTTHQLGAVMKGNFDATQVAAILAYNWNSTDSTRIGQVTGPYETDIDRDLESLTGLIRVSHQLTYRDSYMTPTFDMGITHLMAGSARESGAGATSLVLQDYDETHAWIRPALRVGNFHDLGRGMKLHFRAEAGLQYFLTDENTHVKAGFAGAPAGVAPMDTPIDLGSQIYMSLGVDMITSKNVTFGVEYTKIADENYEQDVIGVKLNASF